MFKVFRSKLSSYNVSVLVVFFILDIFVLAMCLASKMNWLFFLATNFGFLLGFSLVLLENVKWNTGSVNNKKFLSRLASFIIATFAFICVVASIGLILTTLITQQNIIEMMDFAVLLVGFTMGLGSLSSETDDSSGAKGKTEYLNV